ncbi:hypothetical protein ACFL37_00040 [Candidatus Margulisiibacteriota bacterium]
MKRFGFIALILVLLGSVALAEIFWPVYWAQGTVKDAADGSGVMAESHRAVFYRSDQELNERTFAEGLIGIPGSQPDNRYMFNLYQKAGLLNLTAGSSGYIAVFQDENGYGAGPVEVSLSGKGFDEMPELTMAYGAGPIPPDMEPPPIIKLWFGERLYQPEVYTEGMPFVISKSPQIEAKISIAEPFLLSSNTGDYAIVLDAGTASSRDLTISEANMTLKVMGAGDEFKSFTLLYGQNDSEKLDLADGEHVFTVTAKSSGTVGGSQSTATVLATVEVMGGPLRLIGTPITYPSPYSPTRDKLVTIQYLLSEDANVAIYLFDVGGIRVMRLLPNAGEEGGSAGINKVTWDGRTERGVMAGNAIYVGTILNRDENKLLGKFKLTIVD